MKKEFFKNLKLPDKPGVYFFLKTSPQPSPERRERTIKIPAGWLIEQCGPVNGTSWKGYKTGNVGVHEKQALVLINYGGANGLEVLELANKIITSVKEKFGLELTPEVNIV
jgi:UDP-N-acetylmuramate dehydrogenase